MLLRIVQEAAEVTSAIQSAKAGASAYCTNLFADQRKLEDWIKYGEMRAVSSPGVAIFLRKDRGFWHLYFAAGSGMLLQKALLAETFLSEARVVMDIVGDEPQSKGLVSALKSVGFHLHKRLYRMVRAQEPVVTSLPSGVVVGYASRGDEVSILTMLEEAFDPHAEQLPLLHEIEGAVEKRQVLTVNTDGKLAGFLWFETIGMTSTIRYWLVSMPYRIQRVGAALMRSYFALHTSVRRFLLWVVADNEDAIVKYHHYGFRPDGLQVQVLANTTIAL